MKVVKNVFVNTKINKVKLAEIHFNETISDIRWKSGEVDWSEISTKEKLKKFAFNKKNDLLKNEIDGKFNLLMPGAIDPHVHFDTPGFEFREDFEHGTIAAANGGVTTIIDMPCTSLPPVTNATNFEIKEKALSDRSLIDYLFRGGVRGNDFDDPNKIERQINELSEKGVPGYKVYVISGMETFTDLTYEQIKIVANFVKQTGKPLCVHAEDKKLVTERRRKFIGEGRTDWKAYCEARDVQAEVVAVKKMIEIARETETRIHIVHLSSVKALEEIEKAKNEGIRITAETCPHYLFFNQNDFNNPEIRNYLKTAPPVKFESDNSGLWKGLSRNQIEFVTTDHAGCIPEKEKSDENFWKVYGGIPGVEHRVPFLFSEGFVKNKLTLEQTIALLSTNVAEFYSLKNKGEIAIGKDADFAFVNLWENEIVKSENMHSKGKYTPFEKTVFYAIIEKTFLRGSLVFSRDGLAEVKHGFGKLIKL